MKNIPKYKLQLVVSSPSPQLSVINVSVNFKMSKQKNVNTKIGRSDHYFYAGTFFLF